MIVRSAKNHEEVVKCVDLYIGLNDESVVKSNRQHAINSLYKHVSAHEFFRVVEVNGEVHGWILGIIGVSDMSGELTAEQLFYASDFTGVKAVKTLVVAHEALIEWAKTRGAKSVQSNCSHLDNSFQLCRILAKHGWRTYNYLAIYDL